MKSPDIEQALQAILLYARFRHAEEWRAGEVQATAGLAKAALDMIKGRLFVALDDYNT